jgi:deoxyadenosine/deoxycytidine kinase
MPHPYVAVEGAIGVGKTTLSRIVGQQLPAEVLLEVFEENPFLGDFYADRSRYAFQTQLFFLLSRFSQQHRVIGETTSRSLLVSDYLFDKDWLFAHLNLSGDELAMYERVHAILGERIPAPSLVVYLRASTDVLMGRIASRDRIYERNMERSYIDSLRLAYDRYFESYRSAPVLVIDTDTLDFAHDPGARNEVLARIRNSLQAHAFQPRLPDLDSEGGLAPRAARNAGPLFDGTRQPRSLPTQSVGRAASLQVSFAGLIAALGELGAVLASAWRAEDAALVRVGNRLEAHEAALENVRAELRAGVANALERLLSLAADADIDPEVLLRSVDVIAENDRSQRGQK